MPRKSLLVYPLSPLLLFLPIIIGAATAGYPYALAAEASGPSKNEPLRLRHCCALVERYASEGWALRVLSSRFIEHSDFSAQRSQIEPKMTAGGSAPTLANSDAVKIVFGVMSFAPGSDRLTDIGAGRCDLVLKKFRKHKSVNVVVESESGTMGARQKDAKLNWRRAQAVRERLLNLGVPREQMSSPVLGIDARPVRSETDWARPAPPKVEFIIRTATSP